MSDPAFNKYRAAVQVLQRGRDVLVECLAEEILGNADDLVEGGFALNELLDGQGPRLHFLLLLIAQLEQSAEALDEASNPASPAAPKKRRSRAKKISNQPSAEGSADDA
jgi:hypothetical protein